MGDNFLILLTFLLYQRQPDFRKRIFIRTTNFTNIRIISININQYQLISICFLYLLSCIQSIAQDIHFSQYYLSPLNLNPALTGLFDEDFRFVGNHRNQWSSVSIPYLTFSGSYEFNFQKQKYSELGFGILFNNDKAGTSEFTTNQHGFSFSYHRTFSRIFNKILSFGVQGNYFQQHINSQNLHFDSQYDGDAFNPNLPANELFNNLNISFFDVSAGTNLQWTFNEKTYFNTGVALFHINSPKQSFCGNNNRLDPKFIFYFNDFYRVHPIIGLFPNVMIEKQGKYHEVVLGILSQFSVVYSSRGDKTTEDKTTVSFGAMYRVKDAIIPTVRFDINRLRIGISYDINISGLTPASQGRGGYEIGVIYIFKFPEIPDRYRRYRRCPVFL